MKNHKIQPVLLGGDINCYSVARAFHEAYGVKSYAFGKYALGATKDSRIIDYTIESAINEPAVFIPTILQFGQKLKSKGYQPILMGCTDEYAELIIDHKDKLSKVFITPYINAGLKEQLISKDSFYQLCQQHGLAYPKTHVYQRGESTDAIDIDFPLIVKPADSISYWVHSFAGMKKAYLIENWQAFNEITDQIYRSGYDKALIIQDYIPGADANMRVMTCYSDQSGQVKMMCLGHVLLEEHAPKAIGNHAAIITEYDDALNQQIKQFLEAINYTGFSNFDIKYDVRDGQYKVFEINLRQGRSNYYVTGSGFNIAKYVVEDHVLQSELALQIQTDAHYWHVIPNHVVFNYVADQHLIERVKTLIAQNSESTSFGYAYDLKFNFKRRLYILLYSINQIKKYKRYFK